MNDPSVAALHLALDVDGRDVHALRAAVAAAEQAGFALVTFADGPLAQGVPEAGTRAAFVSRLTDRIGLAPTLHATVTEPFHLATQLAALDHASHGRAGWIVGAANSVDERATIGAAPLTPEQLREELADVTSVARALWDSWEDDAVIKDAATGRYLDPDKVHHVDFIGESFTVKGPLITPRPLQGQIVVLAPDALELDKLADVVLIERADVAAIGERARAAKEAGAALAFAEVSFGFAESGSVAELVDLLRSLAAVVDGVRLRPASAATDVPVLIEQVLPVLAAEGLLRPAPRPGDTLRATLGLPRPANRFAREGAVQR